MADSLDVVEIAAKAVSYIMTACTGIVEIILFSSLYIKIRDKKLPTKDYFKIIGLAILLDVLGGLLLVVLFVIGYGFCLGYGYEHHDTIWPFLGCIASFLLLIIADLSLKLFIYKHLCKKYHLESN